MDVLYWVVVMVSGGMDMFLYNGVVIMLFVVMGFMYCELYCDIFVVIVIKMFVVFFVIVVYYVMGFV